MKHWSVHLCNNHMNYAHMYVCYQTFPESLYYKTNDSHHYISHLLIIWQMSVLVLKYISRVPGSQHIPNPQLFHPPPKKKNIISWKPEGRYCHRPLYIDSTLLVLNRTSMNCNKVLLALNWWYILCCYWYPPTWIFILKNLNKLLFVCTCIVFMYLEHRAPLANICKTEGTTLLK